MPAADCNLKGDPLEDGSQEKVVPGDGQMGTHRESEKTDVNRN